MDRYIRDRMDVDTKTALTVRGIAVLAGAFAVAALFSMPRHAAAATLDLTPASGTYSAGQLFDVSVDVSSSDAAVNAAQATISFPPGTLNVEGVSEDGSIANLWVQQPSYSNTAGTVSFAAVTVNPGFTGPAGHLITITFRAEAPGNAEIAFVSGAALANDGKGTNILTGMNDAQATIAPAGGSSASSGPAPAGAGRPPLIVSVPAVNDRDWYNLDSITFSWTLPPGTTGVNYAISNDPGYQLLERPQAPVSSATYNLSTFADGVWYFYASVDRGGSWSPVAERILRLDRTPPEPFVIVQQNAGPSAAASRPVFQWVATDNMSGIAYYRAKIGSGDWFDPASIEQDGLYVLPPQSTALSRTLTVRAYDNAGNYREEQAVFSVLPSGCAGNAAWCSVVIFSEWNWWWMALILLALYLAVRRITVLKRNMKKELVRFGSALERDLRSMEADSGKDVRVPGAGTERSGTPASVGREEGNMQKAADTVRDRVREELDAIDRL